MTRRGFLASTVALFGAPPALGQTPALHVPPEEAPHQRTFMQWPVNRRVYRDAGFLRATQDTIVTLANTIAGFEPVTLLAGAQHHAALRPRLTGAVTLWDIPTDDLWCRDAGPLFARLPDGGLAVSHIQFNGWGEKQDNRHDSQIAARVAERLGLPLIPAGLRGEPGGVDHDGHGLMIAHESSWVIDNRNPGLSRTEIERRLLDSYGADRMIWAPGVRDQDITDYHIDSLARFTGPGRVLITLPPAPDPHDPFHRAARETHDTLVAAGLRVDVIPEPARRRIRSADFVASYVNYYACNGAIIMPHFGDRDADEQAQAALARHYPDRQIVALNTDPLGELGGGIHCATQQMPA